MQATTPKTRLVYSDEVLPGTTGLQSELPPETRPPKGPGERPVSFVERHGPSKFNFTLRVANGPRSELVHDYQQAVQWYNTNRVLRVCRVPAAHRDRGLG